MFKQLRILVLLLILLIVALSAFFDRLYSTDWDNSLRVLVLPINADGSERSQTYIESLGADHWQPIEAFFAGAAKGYGITLEQPVRIRMGPTLTEVPPLVEPGTNILGVMSWSLRLRYYAWRQTSDVAGPTPDVRIFVLYHDPDRSPALPHSVGLQKGLIGLVHAFADREMAGSNDVVIAHELLHTLGATDKYGPDNFPLHPIGFAEPDRTPLLPQRYAELMGGRIPVKQGDARIPESLRAVRIGPFTAAEIGWTSLP